MNLIRKNLFKIAIVLSVIILFSSFVYADTADDKTQIEKVKLSVESSFMKFIPSLEADKKDFGLSGSESYSNANLGDGIPYYVLSKDLLNNGKLDDDAFTLDGYLFPIKVNGKTTGMATAQQDSSGQWAITDISSDSTYEGRILDAKKVFKDNIPTKLIYDRGFFIFAVAGKANSGYDIVSTEDNGSWDMKKNEIKSLDDLANKVVKHYNGFKQRKMTDSYNTPGGGIGDINTPKTSHNYILPFSIILIIVVFGSSISIVYFRRRKLVSR